MDRNIDYVIAVAECGSISQAAELLYISQPSLSRFLSSLEDELGISLFVRTINGTELTEAGRIYVKYAKEIRLLRSTMDYELRALKRSGSERIRIGMTLNAASLSAFNVAEKVKKKYPQCEVEFFNIMSKDIEETLRLGKYDLAIGPHLDFSSDFSYDLLYKDPFILVVPDRYDLDRYAKPQVDKSGNPALPLIDLRELPPLDYILQETTTAVGNNIQRMFRKLKCSITPKMWVTNSTLAIQAAENGIGCCIAVVGHLVYLNRMDHLKFYQLEGAEYSTAGVIYLYDRVFTKEEKYCISCIKKALTAGEAEVTRRLKEAGKFRV